MSSQAVRVRSGRRGFAVYSFGKVVREAKEKAPIIAELGCGEITCTNLVLYEIIHIFAELNELNYGRCKQ